MAVTGGIAAVITAAGNSSRMGRGGVKKEYQNLPGSLDSEGRALTVGRMPNSSAFCTGVITVMSVASM
jgi:hypothetical protein